MTHLDPEQTLTSLGLALPTPPTPVAAYIPFRRSGNLVFVSGQIPMKGGSLIASGRVPSGVSVETAQQCAVQCALNGLAVVKSAAGSLSAVRQVVRLGVFVACDESFTQQPTVANAASELLVRVFGEAGRHARAAVGAPSLPLGAPVEIEFVFEVASERP